MVEHLAGEMQMQRKSIRGETRSEPVTRLFAQTSDWAVKDDLLLHLSLFLPFSLSLFFSSFKRLT